MSEWVKPVLLVDVDGVLNVWSMRDPVAPPWEVHPDVPGGDGSAYRLVLNPEHGAWLRGLSEVVSLVWCTTWWRVANQEISPRVGLPSDLPAVWLPDPNAMDKPPGYAAKTPFVRQWAAREGITRLAWLDDDVDEDADRAALTAPAVTSDPRLAGIEPLADPLLVRVDPTRGLTPQHLERIRDWVGTEPR